MLFPLMGHSVSNQHVFSFSRVLHKMCGHFRAHGFAPLTVCDEVAVGEACFFSIRSVKQRQDILTNTLAVNTHLIARKTQIAQCAAVNNWGDTWNIIRWWAFMY